MNTPTAKQLNGLLMNQPNKIYLLFTVTKKRFDPALVGVFLDKKIAAKAESKIQLSHPDHTASFILETPISNTVEEYANYWKTTIAKKVVKNAKRLKWE
jgi:hypothetical protein